MAAVVQLSQPSADLVLMHTSCCCGLLGVALNNPDLAHPQSRFCIYQPLLWPSLAQPTLHLSLMHTHRCR